MDLILFLGIFIVVLVLAQALFMFVRSRFNPEVVRLKREISTLSAGRNGASGVDIVKKRTLSQIPWLNEILVNLQSADDQPPGTAPPAGRCKAAPGLLHPSVGGHGGGRSISDVCYEPECAGGPRRRGAGGLLPWVYLSFRKNRRLRDFERQLPDALDMIARALKAGHALTGGFQMVAMEFADPARTEFRKTLDEINFGQSYEDALRNMSKRFDCPDLKFFVLSVIIQRQSGGNMAEILEKIGSLIRERFKLFGKVKALTGEARISAVVLTILPFAIAASIYFLNRDYLEVLFTEPAGQIMVGAAAVMMVLGIFVMKRMITIEV